MQITVTIPDDFAAHVEARGLTPKSYVEQLIAEEQMTWAAAESGGAHELSSEEFNASLDALTQFSEKIPSLPIEALSRESFYDGHD